LYEMRTIAMDVAGICQSECLSVRWAGCAKTAEHIDVLFEVRDSGHPRHVVLDWCYSVTEIEIEDNCSDADTIILILV